MDYETCTNEAVEAEGRGDLANAQFWATLALAAAIREGLAQVSREVSR